MGVSVRLPMGSIMVGSRPAVCAQLKGKAL
jgi:hypothetical protein